MRPLLLDRPGGAGRSRKRRKETGYLRTIGFAGDRDIRSKSCSPTKLNSIGGSAEPQLTLWSPYVYSEYFTSTTITNSVQKSKQFSSLIEALQKLLIKKKHTMNPEYSLTPEQKRFYDENGYLLGMPPIYTREEMCKLADDLPQLMALLRPGETPKDIREWHETSRWLFDICMNPKIHDLVEGILGPDFYLWASSFFVKEPHTKETVGWHQDAYYWPMVPHNSVTVWLAFDDVDEENGAMKIVPGSHKSGILQHRRSTVTDSILTLELERGSFREDTAVSMRLKAGEVSLHDDAAVHGSPANLSNRRRVGLTMRFSGTNVKNDLKVNPNFKTYLCRGVDRFKLNPVGVAPSERFARPAFVATSIEEAGPEHESILKG